MKKTRLILGITAATAAVGIGGGIASAVWSVSGTGSATGAADVSQSLVVTAITPGSSGDSLYPGGPAGFVYFTVRNPNPFPIDLTGFTWGTPTSSNTATCPSSNFSIDANAPLTTDIPIAADTQSGAFQVFNVVDMAHSAPDGCQGVDVTVPLTVTGAEQ
jgi:hypothetical protein